MHTGICILMTILCALIESFRLVLLRLVGALIVSLIGRAMSYVRSTAHGD